MVEGWENEFDCLKSKKQENQKKKERKKKDKTIPPGLRSLRPRLRLSHTGQRVPGTSSWNKNLQEGSTSRDANRQD